MKDLMPGLRAIHINCSDLEKSINFYTHILGMVCKPVSYIGSKLSECRMHFESIDSLIGTDLLLSSSPDKNLKGRRGNGMVTHIGFLVEQDSLEGWMELFSLHKISFNRPLMRDGRRYLTFTDPDGMRGELIEPKVQKTGYEPSSATMVTRIYQLSICLKDIESTRELLTKILGYELLSKNTQRYQFVQPEAYNGPVLELLERPNDAAGIDGYGTVDYLIYGHKNHHSFEAFRPKIPKKLISNQQPDKPFILNFSVPCGAQMVLSVCEAPDIVLPMDILQKMEVAI